MIKETILTLANLLRKYCQCFELFYVIRTHEILIEEMIREDIESTLKNSQCCLRRGRLNTKYFTIRQVRKKLMNKNKHIHICFNNIESTQGTTVGFLANTKG